MNAPCTNIMNGVWSGDADPMMFIPWGPWAPGAGWQNAASGGGRSRGRGSVPPPGHLPQAPAPLPQAPAPLPTAPGTYKRA